MLSEELSSRCRPCALNLNLMISLRAISVRQEFQGTWKFLKIYESSIVAPGGTSDTERC